MQDTDGTLVTFLLDRSGSMAMGADDTVGAFNTYLKGLKSDPEGILFSFVQFDTQGLEKVYVRAPVSQVDDLTMATFQPRGGTPLIDSAYKTIKAVEASNPAGKVVICIQTDGEENSSTEHTWEALQAIIAEKSKLGWQFNFMGAGIDAYKQGARMGISAASTMSYDRTQRATMDAAFGAMSANTMAFARGMAPNTSYSASQRQASGDVFAPLDLTVQVSATATKKPVEKKKAEFTL